MVAIKSTVNTKALAVQAKGFIKRAEGEAIVPPPAIRAGFMAVAYSTDGGTDSGTSRTKTIRMTAEALIGESIRRALLNVLRDEFPES
jgi:hypothetical protein